jgi:hypothetical protein
MTLEIVGVAHCVMRARIAVMQQHAQHSNFEDTAVLYFAVAVRCDRFRHCFARHDQYLHHVTYTDNILEQVLVLFCSCKVVNMRALFRLYK